MSYPLENCDYFIYLKELPPRIYAFVMLNPDGTYSVFLDPRRDYEHWIDDLEHEWWHMLRDDLYDSTRQIWEIEAA